MWGIYRLIREATVTREVLIRLRENSVDDNVESEDFATAEVIEILDFITLDVVSAMKKRFYHLENERIKIKNTFSSILIQ